MRSKYYISIEKMLEVIVTRYQELSLEVGLGTFSPSFPKILMSHMHYFYKRKRNLLRITMVNIHGEEEQLKMGVFLLFKH